MRRVLILLFLALPLIAQNRRGDWVTYGDHGCIGGSKCPDKRLRIKLADRPVLGVRFTAHDDIGETAGGKLTVKVGADAVRSYIDIPRRGETFTIDVDNRRGEYLTLEAAANDEIEIKDIAVMYGSGFDRDHDNDRGNSGGGGWQRGGGGNREGWRTYDRAGTCIGGAECRQNGNRITIALDDQPVLGIRFNAHDNVGTRADGKLNVRIDDHSVASYVDVARDGKRHEFDVDNLVGSKLVISTANDDEVVISDIAVLYGHGDGGRSYDSGAHERSYGAERETRNSGACIGGSECGGSRAKIRIALHGASVTSVRFFAHDSVGAKAGGELRVRIDDEILRDYIDIPRDGRTFNIDAHHISGDWLIIETAADDEVVVKDIRVTYRE